MTHIPHIGPGDAVLVFVRTDGSYDVGTHEPLFVPEGTRLIGTWEPVQPPGGAIYAVVVGGTLWHFAVENVTLSPLAEPVQPWQEQERLARESQALAQEAERQQRPATAQRLYARVLVEREACGKTSDELADVRQKRAFLLREVGKIEEAISEFERLARTYEAAAFSPGYGGIDRGSAELAAQALNALGRTILHHSDCSSDLMQQKLHRVASRMQSMLKHIGRRYETKAEVLLTLAEISSVLGNQSEALSQVAQAEALYQQHLTAAASSGAVALHLARVKEAFGLKDHPRRPAAQTRRRTKGR